jgi:hypothetical protein
MLKGAQTEAMALGAGGLDLTVQVAIRRLLTLSVRSSSSITDAALRRRQKHVERKAKMHTTFRDPR